MDWTSDNGNVIGITNNRDTSRSQSFTYDALNRLTSAQNTGTDCTQKTVNGGTKYWGNNYGYDPWGNLLQKTPTKCSAENLNVTALANNQLSGYGYDAAGNMTHDATTGNNYTFDAENRIIGAAGYTYTYDADGNRVEKSNGSTGTIYWYMTPGIIAESDLTGALKSEYVFFDGERVARKDFPGNAVSYYFSDHLKTASVITDAAGNIKEDEDYYPWGGELQFVDNDSNHYKFGGHERDNETGLDYMLARYYSNPLGRFLTPDWATKPITVPYANLGNPQSLNLYTFSKNNPTTFGDPDGHCPDGICYDITKLSPAQVQRLADHTTQVAIGMGKAGINAITSTFNFVSRFGTRGPVPIPQLKPKNHGQAQGMAIGTGAVVATAALSAGTALTTAAKTPEVVDVTANVRAASVIAPVAAEGPSAGESVFRVWGGEAGPNGRSWTPIDPDTVPNYRDAAGLPDANAGTWTTKGTLTDPTGVQSQPATPLDGNQGGLPEYKIPDPSHQVDSKYMIKNDPPK